MCYEVSLITIQPSTLDTYVLLTNLANCRGDDPIVKFLGVPNFILPTGKRFITVDTDPLRVFFIVVSSHNVE